MVNASVGGELAMWGNDEAPAVEKDPADAGATATGAAAAQQHHRVTSFDNQGDDEGGKHSRRSSFPSYNVIVPVLQLIRSARSPQR
jgi:hypothetical protein